MFYKLESAIKLLTIFAPVVFFILPGSAVDSGNPLALLVIAFPYLVILVFTQFVKHKSLILLIGITVLLVLLIISSALMLLGTDSVIGISIAYIAQVLLVALFISIYFVIHVISSSVNNKPIQRDTNA